MLRKIFFWSFLLFLFVGLSIVINIATTQALAASSQNSPGPKTYVDDVLLTSDVPAVIEAGTTLMPFRALFEALGANVLWDEENRLVLGIYKTTAVKLFVGTDKIEVNGKISKMPVPVKLISGRTMIPLRTVSEAFGFKVDWDGVNKLISIRSPQPTEFKVVNGQNVVEIDITKLPD